MVVQMMLREYAEGDDESDHQDHDGNEISDDPDIAPQLITSRDDFGSMVNDFLDNYEILGSRMKPKLKGETGAEKLGILRTAMGHDVDRTRLQEEVNDDEHELLQMEDEDEKDRWDCETILSGCSSSCSIPVLTINMPQLHTLTSRIIPDSFEQETQTSSRKYDLIHGPECLLYRPRIQP